MAQTGKTRKPPKRSKSVLKRQRQNIKKRARNGSYISAMRTEVKKFNSLIENKDIDKAKAFLSEVVSTIARLGAKGVLRKQTASRRISRIYKSLNNLTNVKAR
ncbi:MAG: 30S ribosomal protein S20 [Deltaproteobacteria bacterium]|nr:30S ribosomal protein S20 [Deltaproteobacteria bacterium]MCL5791827.1 30S ribosomal protein S20 [Deltaproteobacteria bacterium]